MRDYVPTSQDLVGYYARIFACRAEQLLSGLPDQERAETVGLLASMMAICMEDFINGPWSRVELKQDRGLLRRLFGR